MALHADNDRISPVFENPARPASPNVFIEKPQPDSPASLDVMNAIVRGYAILHERKESGRREAMPYRRL